jgi:hypothetical protein
MITITGAGDHDPPDWLITMTGIRNHAEDERERLVKALRHKALAVIAQHAADICLEAEVDRLQRAALDHGLRLAWFDLVSPV